MGGDGVPQAKALWPGTRGCRSRSREQGRRKRGVWSGRQDWGAAPSDTHPPPTFGHHCSQQDAVQLSSPPSSVGVERCDGRSVLGEKSRAGRISV